MRSDSAGWKRIKECSWGCADGRVKARILGGEGSRGRCKYDYLVIVTCEWTWVPKGWVKEKGDFCGFSTVDIYLGFGCIVLLEMVCTSFFIFSLYKFGILIKIHCL